jgi:integrative and conjugative element protein (TIGR02256 family)
MSAIKKVEISTESLRLIEAEVTKARPLETGGVIVGRIRDNVMTIDKVSGPGPHAVHEIDYFQADPNYVDMFIDLHYANSNGESRYLGEWHCHPQVQPEPSPKDLVSLSEIADDHDDAVLLLIVGAIGFSADSFASQSIAITADKQLNHFLTPDIRCI